MKIYLDNCCYNRPYDDQSQIRISLEAQAKLHIQGMIKEGKIELASSYILRYENSRNPYDIRKKTIEKFIHDNTAIYIDESYSKVVGNLASEIMSTGVKNADAHHTASAIAANCDYLITTDDRLLKYKSDKITIIDPIGFVKLDGGVLDV